MIFVYIGLIENPGFRFKPVLLRAIDVVLPVDFCTRPASLLIVCKSTSCSRSRPVSINAVFGLEATKSNLLRLSVSSSVITSEAGTKPGGGRDFCCHIATKWFVGLIFDQRRGNS